MFVSLIYFDRSVVRRFWGVIRWFNLSPRAIQTDDYFIWRNSHAECIQRSNKVKKSVFYWHSSQNVWMILELSIKSSYQLMCGNENDKIVKKHLIYGLYLRMIVTNRFKSNYSSAVTSYFISLSSFLYYTLSFMLLHCCTFSKSCLLQTQKLDNISKWSSRSAETDAPCSHVM